MDIWMYIQSEGIEIPSLYFAHRREVVKRDGMWMATWPNVIEPLPGEAAERKLVRFRTIGDISCTGAVESSASNLHDVIQEIAAARVTERGGRADDKRSEAAMEDRKKQGYF
jgi:sulfate adenylyltransferase subunit 2